MPNRQPVSQPMSTTGAVRIAVALMAAPVVCCLAGLAVVTLLQHQAKGGADFFRYTVMRGGKLVEVQGPDARPDMVAAGAPLTAALHRLRGETAVTPGCPAAPCIQLPPGTALELRARIGAILGVVAPDAAAPPPDAGRLRRYAGSRLATSSSITSVAPPPIDWMRASRTMRSMALSRR